MIAAIHPLAALGLCIAGSFMTAGIAVLGVIIYAAREFDRSEKPKHFENHGHE